MKNSPANARQNGSCPQCGATVEARPGRGRPRVFCDTNCRYAYQAVQDAQKRVADRNKVCPACQIAFTGNTAAQRFCSPKCRSVVHRAQTLRTRACIDCNADLSGTPSKVRCKQCAVVHRKKRAQGQRHERRLKAGARSERFKPIAIFERDGWICQLCQEPVDPERIFPDQLSASLDHKVPLSLGGDHTAANSQLAHLACNIRRHNNPEPTEAHRGKAANRKPRTKASTR